MVQVYTEPLCRRYYGSVVGEASLFRFFAYLSAIVLALVVAFATGGFWVKLTPDNIQATVSYTQDAILIFEGAESGQVAFWSTSPVLNAEFSNLYTAASVQVSSIDVNDDGKADLITFQASMANAFPVHSVKALLQFHYSLTGHLQLDMYSFAYLAQTSPAPGAALFTDGELLLSSMNQLQDRNYNSRYNSPMLNSSTPSYSTAVQPSVALEMQSILSSYLTRNFTTTYSNNYPVWVSGTGTSFNLQMRIRIPPNQVIFYRPQAIEMLKFGWIQWLATFIVLWYLLQWAEWFVFYYRLVETRIVSDLQQRQQRF
ncbi:hypothetical protein HXX76_008597 [Chlamydomonas incerta]|uniref:Transmembrane protein 231 n=1 Tax=Chlamydomonas incerta TaxID=51695 RepID=A0A835VYR1_CHLIN|nr:hypothetical protein HXX76_008597 [Chlamydomonas incerta]|eukprot:KAG2432865.1 hypothetical protein HXX76_008597 [Chlamydomonas incerta]